MAAPKKAKPTRRVKIVAEKTEWSNIRFGELYSELDGQQWRAMLALDGVLSNDVHVRMRGQLTDAEAKQMVYRFTVIIIDGDGKEQVNTHEEKSDFSPHAPPGSDFQEYSTKIPV